MQSLQYDFWLPAAKDKSITHAGIAARNLNTADLRSASARLQNAKELSTTATLIAAPKPDLDAKAKKQPLWSTFQKIFQIFFKGKSSATWVP